MQAAENALVKNANLFPSFDFRNTYLGIKNNEQNSDTSNNLTKVLILINLFFFCYSLNNFIENFK